VEGVGVSVCRDFDVLAGVNRGQIALIDVDENPDRVGIGNGEALRGGSLQKLAGTDETLDNFASNRSDDGNFRGGSDGISGDGVRIFEAKRTQSVRGRCQIRREPGACVRAACSRSASAMAPLSEKIFCAGVQLVGEGRGLARLEVSERKRKNRDCHEKQEAGRDELPGLEWRRFVANRTPMEKRPERFSKAFTNCSGRRQGAGKFSFQDWRDLDVRQLILRDLKGARALSAFDAGGVRGHLDLPEPPPQPAQAAGTRNRLTSRFITRVGQRR